MPTAAILSSYLTNQNSLKVLEKQNQHSSKLSDIQNRNSLKLSEKQNENSSKLLDKQNEQTLLVLEKQKQFEKDQKRLEVQRTIYTKLLANSQNYGEIKTIFYENQMEMYYLMKAKELSPKPDDQIQIDKRIEIDFEFIKLKNIEQKEFLELVALAQISFDMDSELETVIDEILNFKPYNFHQYPKTTLLSNLDIYYSEYKNEYNIHMSRYNFLRNHLIKLLKNKLKNKV